MIHLPGAGRRLGPALKCLHVALNKVAAPALRRSPRDHAAALTRPKEKPALAAAHEIAARESHATASSRPVQTNAISRVAAWNASGPGLTVRLLSRCEPRRRVRLPLAAMSERAHHAKAFASLRLRPSGTATARLRPLRPGRSVPTREADPTPGRP